MCQSDAQWDELFQQLDKQIAGYERFKGKLGGGPQALTACFQFDRDFDRLAERVGGYAHLKMTEDQANSTYQAMVARFQNLASRASQAASYIRPEILAACKGATAAHRAPRPRGRREASRRAVRADRGGSA